MISRLDIEMWCSFLSFLFYGINIRGVSYIYKRKKKKIVKFANENWSFFVIKKNCE